MTRKQALSLVRTLTAEADSLNKQSDAMSPGVFGLTFTASLVLGGLSKALMETIQEGAFDE